MRGACSLLLTFLAFAALAADEEAAETGTIEVEVVYKDTGEPVVGVYVMADPEPRWSDDRSRLRAMTGSDGRVVFEEAACGSYKVHTGCVSSPEGLKKYGPTKFRFTLADCKTVITIGGEKRDGKIRFEVERGAQLLGTVRLGDGTPLAGAWVSAAQDEREYDSAAAITDGDGRYNMYGLRAGARAGVFIVSPTWLQDYPFGPSRALRAIGIGWCRDVEVEGVSTVLDIEVRPASLELQVELIQPLWPFPTHIPCPGIWLDHDPKAEPRLPNIRVNTGWLSPASESRRTHTVYRLVVDELPAGAQATAGLGAWYHVSSPTPRALPSYTSYRTIILEEGRQKITLVAVAPYARLSRALVYGVPLVIVLAVCVTILVRQVRRRRPRESSE